jgi:DNA-binding Xre family transcriptional regulator
VKINYNKLFAYMAKNNISKRQLAEKAGISRNTIIKMAHGELVHMSILVAICEAYNLTLSDIIQEEV